MTQKQVTQYRCDFCKKRGLSAGHMRKHEKHCTANPNRVCRMCGHCQQCQKPIPELIAALREGLKDNECDLKQLREAAGDCVACMLSAIRQSGIQKWDGDPESVPVTLSFNLKDEMKSFWEEFKQESCY